MRFFALCVLMLLAVPSAFSAVNVADSVSLNGTWKFKTDLYKKGDSEQWFKASADKSHWDSMVVPGNWDTRNEYSDYAGDAWYSYTFKATDNWTGKNVRLVFQSVYNDSEIWLNGIKVGENHLGYLQFVFDINSYLKAGEANELVLKVNNVVKRGAIWNWGGIRRPVWIEITDPVRVNRLAVSALPDRNYQASVVNLKAYIANYATTPALINYTFEIFYKQKSVYASGLQKPVPLGAKDSIYLSHRVDLPAAKTHLWHFDHPELYTARVSIYRGKEVLHSWSERFGIRKIEVDGMKLRLNGEEIRPVGFNLVPEDRITGNTLPAERIRKMVDLMKQCGANMARISHMPLPKEFLDYLDEKGIMTFEEVSLWGKDNLVDPNHPLPKRSLEKLIAQQYNHPSVIGWSVGNEIGSIKNNPLAAEYIKGAIDNARRMDPDRLAIYVSNTANSQANDPAVFADLIMLNGYSNWGDVAEKAHSNVPGKPVFFSEFGDNLNDEDPDKSTINFQKMLQQVRGKDFVIGASLWTFNDYRSMYWSAAPNWSTPPSGNRAWGVVNTFLQKKKSYEQVRRTYLPVHISAVQLTGDHARISGSLFIQPKDKLDFPAYQLKGYTVSIISGKGKETSVSQQINLPVMNPGDAGKTYSFSVTREMNADFVSIQLNDPQQYSRFDTTIFFTKPGQPVIKSVHTSASSARIVFEKSDRATTYSVKYGLDELTAETPETIDDFIDIKNLNGKKAYQFQVQAHNNAGVQVSTKGSFMLSEQELPPVIWNVEPVKSGFFISFSSDHLDYRYEIEYGTETGRYTKLLTLNNKGVLQVPGLMGGKTYFFRMRRIMQWGFPSVWTHEMHVKPY